MHLSFGDASGREYATQLTFDLAVHAWDLAGATGQDEAINPDAVTLLLSWVEPNIDLLAASGLFGPAVALGPGVSDQDRLLGLAGRRP